MDDIYEVRHMIKTLGDDVAVLKALAAESSRRTTATEELLAAHIKTCDESKKGMDEVLDAVNTIKAGMKITNWLRNAFIWIAGLAIAVITLWQSWRGN